MPSSVGLGLNPTKIELKTDCIRLHRDVGNLKQDIEWVGIAERTDLSITILPADDKYRVDHPLAFCRILSTVEVKRSFFLLPKGSGNPRYFPTPPSFCISSSLFTLSFKLLGAFREKVMAGFCLFIICPDACSYSFNISFSLLMLCWFVRQKNIVSSVKRRWLTLGHSVATRIPCNDPSFWAFKHKPKRTSLQRMNKYGDSGSPCRKARDGMTLPLAVSLIRKENETVFTHCIIKPTHFLSNPSLLSTSSMKLHSSLSYVLLISVFTAMEQCLLAVDVLRKWSNSCVMRTLSEMARSGTKLTDFRRLRSRGSVVVFGWEA